MNHIIWQEGVLILLDQRKLPLRQERVICKTYEEVAAAIRDMVVRGAPAIGVVAAYGLVMAAAACRESLSDSSLQGMRSMRSYLEDAAQHLKETRPTAVNLVWALERMLDKVMPEDLKIAQVVNVLTEEADLIRQEDLAANKSIGKHGISVLPTVARILTYCNAGALATAGFGTALGVVRAGQAVGKVKMVYACETRPFLQGARLTCWELMEDKIPVTLITDNMVGYLMYKKMLDLVIVGADRITAAGDVANKIGTYSLAVLAKEHQIPFYVAAPLSSFDLSLEKASQIPIEERAAKELSYLGEVQIAPEEVGVFNPSFDITPASLVTAIITEKGLLRHPDREKITTLFKRE